MDTWIPIWTSTVDSTLWEEPLHVRVMFFTLMMIRDPDHVVRDPFRRIVKYAHLSDKLEESVELARDALRILSEPDSKSIDSQEYEGRRIKAVEGGWLMLNGEKYEERRRLLSARIRKTQKQREYRAAKAAGKLRRLGPMPGEPHDRTEREERVEGNGI